MKRKVTDTSAKARTNPEAALLDLPIFGGSSDAIYAQEARGQRELAESSQLPRAGLLVGLDAHSRDGIVKGTPELCPEWKAMGVSLVALGDDTAFCDVTLPGGWKIKPTNHSMWSDLLDEKGRKRAAIFYKAAFYDRSAFIHAERRFNAISDYGGEYGSTFPKGEYRTLVTDANGGHAFVSEPTPTDDFTAREKGRQAAEAWLDANWPDWKNPTAYWDDASKPKPRAKKSRKAARK